MSDPRFVEAVRAVEHRKDCEFLTSYGERRQSQHRQKTEGGPRAWLSRCCCTCDRDERIAAGLQVVYYRGNDCLGAECSCVGSALSAFTSASAPKEG